MGERERERDRDRSDVGVVTAAYGSRAAAYIHLFGSAEKADAEDRALIRSWSSGLGGRVLDAGCGPGQWAAFLHALGVEVEGADATPEFIAHATRQHPDIDFRVEDLRRITLAEGSLGGVLAWFSLIHAEPDEVPDLLRTFARALQPGGSLLIGFFSATHLQRFDHRVVTAWAWPVDDMARAVASAGLEVVSTRERGAPNGRVNAAIVARRTS